MKNSAILSLLSRSFVVAKVSLKPSKMLRYTFCLLHLFFAMIILRSTLSLPCCVLFECFLVLHAIYTHRRCGVSYQFAWDNSARGCLMSYGGQEYEVSVHRSSLITAGLSILRLQRSGRHRLYSIVILPDSLSDQAYHLLRIAMTRALK